jgi:LPS-assembly lipoprotein
MSWFDRLPRLALVPACALALGGCLQPLHGQRVFNESSKLAEVSSVSEMLRQVQIVEIGGRTGQQIRNNLIFAFNGGAQPLTPRYRLVIDIESRGQEAVVDPFTDRAEVGTVGIDALFRLIPVGTLDPVLTGNAFGRASYTSTRQRFANTRAIRDAQDRAAGVVAEQIRTRLSAHFAAAGS